jgi:hypothetical protein
MKTIKFYPSDRSKIKIGWETITQKKVSQIVKGYTIDSIPDECNSWFNYKGLTFVVN